MNRARVIQDTETVEQPQDDHNHDDDVKDFFDRRLHRDVSIDQPKDDANDDQRQNYV